MFEPKFKQIQAKPACSQGDGRGGGGGGDELKCGSVFHNRLYLSSKNSHFQTEANCKTFHIKMSLF